MKNMKIDANGTEIRVMGDIVNEDAYIRCEMTPTSAGGEQQNYISGGILWRISWKQIRIIVLYVWICARFFIWIKKISSKFNINNQF